MKSNERCMHRHTKEEHPSCFKKGAVDRLLWYKNMKIGFLDIETSDFKANRGFMLSWAIKEASGDIAYDVITRADIFSYDFDKRITKTLVDEMNKYDILVTYYGTGFDIPFTRTRALIQKFGREFPVYGQVYHFDVYYRVRNLFKLTRNSLDAATHAFDIDGKTHLDLNIWTKAAYGHKQSLDYIVDHNLEDVRILEELFEIIKPYSKWAKRSL